MTLTRTSTVPVLLPEQIVELAPWQPARSSPGALLKHLRAGEGSTAGLLRLGPGGVEPAHVHPDAEHHLWVVAGSVTVDGTILGPESYVHVPRGARHELRGGDNGCSLFYVYVQSLQASAHAHGALPGTE